MPLRTNQTAVVMAVILATFLAALDTTIVGTAMPTVIGELGGLDLYSWVFSAYLLTSTTAVPLCGRLADVYGRKPVFIGGAVLFLIGSAFCGAATSMEQLILFRAIQGAGAASVVPVSMTVIGDVFSPTERARIQGLLGSVWGISAILGPGLGGLIVERFSWRLVFYVNIPFGIVSCLLLFLFLAERAARKERVVDYAGTFTLTVGVTLLLVGLLEIGKADRTLPLPPWIILTFALSLLAGFTVHQLRCTEPLLPVRLLASPLFLSSNVAGFLAGATLMGIGTYVPPFVQGVMGGTAAAAGAALAPMSVGWSIASALSGRLVLRHGYRLIVIVGSGLILLGALMLLPLGLDAGLASVMLAMIVMGFGMGFGMTAMLVAVQSAVPWERRGVATASVSFFRSIGGAVGVAALGCWMNVGIRDGLSRLSSLHGEESTGVALAGGLSALLDPSARLSLPPETVESFRAVLASSLNGVFSVVAAISIMCLAVSFWFPEKRPEDELEKCQDLASRR